MDSDERMAGEAFERRNRHASRQRIDARMSGEAPNDQLRSNAIVNPGIPFEVVRMMTRCVPESPARTLAASRSSSLEATLGGCCAWVTVAATVSTARNRNVA